MKTIGKLLLAVLLSGLLMLACDNGSTSSPPPPPPPPPQEGSFDNLVLTEIDGNKKYVEIFNNGPKISLNDVKLQKNDNLPRVGGEWVGGAADEIGENAYILIKFKGFDDSTLDALVGGTSVDSDLPNDKILKIALIAPDGKILDTFIRGGKSIDDEENTITSYDTLYHWDYNDGNFKDDDENSYSRKSSKGEKWGLFTPTPGQGVAADAVRTIIKDPGYLTAQPAATGTEPKIGPASVVGNSLIHDTEGAIRVSVIDGTEVSLQWDLNGEPQPDIAMDEVDGVYIATIPPLMTDNEVTYWIFAENDADEFAYSPIDPSTKSRTKTTTVKSDKVYYEDLILTEIDGNNQYVEVYNTGIAVENAGGIPIDIPLSDVSLLINGEVYPITEAGAVVKDNYGLINLTGSVTNPNTKGKVAAKISSGEILKVALVMSDNHTTILDTFIRGQNKLPEWGSTTWESKAVEKDSGHSYTRARLDGTYGTTWWYDDATPGGPNDDSTSGDIKYPMYLTFDPINPPEITAIEQTPAGSLVTEDAVISANITTTLPYGGSLDLPDTPPVIQWSLDDGVTWNDEELLHQGGISYKGTIKFADMGFSAKVIYRIHAVSKTTGGIIETTTSPEFSFETPPDYTKLKLNEVNGVDKFYELINTGDKDISLKGVEIYYYAPNKTTGGVLLPEKFDDKKELTWTGKDTDQPILGNGGLFVINEDQLGTGLTAERVLIIVMKDPQGNEIDRLVRAADTGDFAIDDKSFSRLSGETDGPFYFTEKSPNAENPAEADGLIQLPDNPPVIESALKSGGDGTAGKVAIITAVVRNYDTESTEALTVQLNYTVNGVSAYPATLEAPAYTHTFNAFTKDDKIVWWVTATNSDGTVRKDGSFTVGANYQDLVLNEISGNDKFVEIYNKGETSIPLAGVKIVRNDGASESGPLEGTLNGGEYAIIGFVKKNAPAHELDGAPNIKYVGEVTSGISSGATLKIKLLDPDGNLLDGFIRGTMKFNDPYDETDFDAEDVDGDNGYSRMPSETGDVWAFAEETPGAVNGQMEREIGGPGYFTDTRIDPPIIEKPILNGLTVTAVINGSGIKNVKLHWKEGDVEQTPIDMTGSPYSANITASAGKYWVTAEDGDGETAGSAVQSLPKEEEEVGPQDYASLVFNEISGAGDEKDKYIELYNKSKTTPINLAGVRIYYNGNGDDEMGTSYPVPSGLGKITWTGPNLILQPEDYYLIKGAKVEPPTSTTMIEGLTSQRKIRLTMLEPKRYDADSNPEPDVVITSFTRDADQNTDGFTETPYARIPDGTGKFYYNTRLSPNNKTEGKTNGDDWTGLDPVPTTDVEVNIPAGKPIFSFNSGVYPSGFTLELSAGGNTIYYTLDGSAPDPTDQVNHNDPVRAAATYNATEYNPETGIPITDISNNVPKLATSEYIQQMYPRSNEMWPGHVPTGFVPDNNAVPKATVVRAWSVDKDGKLSDVVTRTYFVGSQLNQFNSTHPVLSLVVDPFDLVSTDRGILIRGNESNVWLESGGESPGNQFQYNYNFQWKEDDGTAILEAERAGNLEIFAPNTRAVVDFSDENGVSVRTRGGYSRGMAQKSFNIYFGKEYGQMKDLPNNLNGYSLIPDAKKAGGTTQVDGFRNFILRNGGNDAESTKFYDVFIQELLNDRSFSTQASIPCQLYINGEYWGPYNLQEKYSDNHAAYKYGIKAEFIDDKGTEDEKDDVKTVNFWAIEGEEVDDGDEFTVENAWNNMIRDGLKDMTDANNYEDFCELFDIDNFIQYWAAQMYINNEDWPADNYRAWRTAEDDGTTAADGKRYGDTKWRWQMYDLDNILGVNADDSGDITKGGYEKDVFERILGTASGDEDNIDLFKSLVANPEFCKQFVNAMMDLYNKNFHPSNYEPLHIEYGSTYNNLMVRNSPSYFDRWGHADGDDDEVYTDKANAAKKYLEEIRGKLTTEYLPLYFGGGAHGIADVTIGINTIKAEDLVDVTFASSGIKVNTITAPTWPCKYYKGNPITVSAEGAVSWKVTTNGVDTVIDGETAEITLTGNSTITPNYGTTGTSGGGFLRALKNFFVR